MWNRLVYDTLMGRKFGDMLADKSISGSHFYYKWQKSFYFRIDNKIYKGTDHDAPVVNPGGKPEKST